MRKLVFVLPMLVLVSCVNPKLTRRYQVHSFSEGASVAHLSAFTLPVTTPSATTFLSLNERGQAALIEALASKSGTSSELIAALTSPLAQPISRAGLKDKTIFKRRVVFSVEHTSQEPVNRLHSVRIDLAITPGHKFVSWDQFATKYETVDLGTVSLDQTASFGFSTSSQYPTEVEELAGVGLTAGQTSLLKEALALKRRYVASSGVLRPTQASLIQQGDVGLDLTGNLMLDVDIDVEDHDVPVTVMIFSGLRKPDRTLSPQENVIIQNQVIVYPRSGKEAVRADHSMQYTVREVGKGHGTIPEGDDHVVFRKGSTNATSVEIIPANDLKFSTWEIRDDSCRILHVVRAPTADPDPIFFETFDEAREFLVWLKESKAVMVGGRQLILGRQSLSTSSIDRLNIAIRERNWGAPQVCG